MMKTVNQLFKILQKEIKEGNGDNEVLIRVWVDDVESTGIKNTIHCSNAVILEPEEKLSRMKQFIDKVKEFSSEYINDLIKMFQI